jgi:hypothetical protein
VFIAMDWRAWREYCRRCRNEQHNEARNRMRRAGPRQFEAARLFRTTPNPVDIGFRKPFEQRFDRRKTANFNSLLEHRREMLATALEDW